MTDNRKSIEDAVGKAEAQKVEKGPIKVGSIVVVGSQRGTFLAEIKKITKKDILIRPVKEPKKPNP